MVKTPCASTILPRIFERNCPLSRRQAGLKYQRYEAIGEEKLNELFIHETTAKSPTHFQ